MQKITSFISTLFASFLFIITAINLFYKTPHGVLSIYSGDRISSGLSSLSPDQFLSFMLIFTGYWVSMITYALIAGYILKIDIKKSLIFALLLGIYIHVTLSLFDLAAHNTQWSLRYNTYYDPVFIYPLLGIYTIVVFTVNILASRLIAFTIVDYFRHGEVAPRDSCWMIFPLPVAILTVYSLFLLRFNRIILLLIVLMVISGLLSTLLKRPPGLYRFFTSRIFTIFQDERVFLCAVAISTLLIRIALSLASKGGMGADDSPYYADLGWRYASGEDVKDLFFPPGYWMYLGAFYKIFGHNHLLLMILQSFIGTTLPLLIYFICRELFDIKTAKLSAILVSINSSIIFYSTIISPESIYTPLTLLSLWLLLKARKSPNLLFFISTGILLGLSIIIKPVIIAFPLIILSWMFLIYKQRRKTILISWVLLVIMVCMVIAPITYRNYINHHRFILIAGFEQVKNTFENPALKDAGIYGDSYGEVFKNIVSSPIGFTMAFLKSAPLQLREIFWGKKIYIPFDLVYIHNASPFAFNLKLYLTLLSLFGVFISIFWERHLWRERLLPLLLIVYYCAMYTFFYGKHRYGMPMLPLTIMFGAYGFYYILNNIRKCPSWNETPTPLRGTKEHENRREREEMWVPGFSLDRGLRLKPNTHRGFQVNVAFWGSIGLIILTIHGLNYSYNNRADLLLHSSRQMRDAGDYDQAKEALEAVIREYPESLSAQYAYHDMIISGVQNIYPLRDILDDYFLLYKGLPYTIETFRELIDMFKKTDESIFKRLQESSDFKKFIMMLDLQEAAVRNIAYNYPRADRIREMTGQILLYLQKMRIRTRLSIAENFLKEGMPAQAEKEFKDIMDMPDRIVFRQWFTVPEYQFAGKTKLPKIFATLYMQYGFHNYALRYHGHL